MAQLPQWLQRSVRWAVWRSWARTNSPSASSAYPAPWGRTRTRGQRRGTDAKARLARSGHTATHTSQRTEQSRQRAASCCACAAVSSPITRSKSPGPRAARTGGSTGSARRAARSCQAASSRSRPSRAAAGRSGRPSLRRIPRAACRPSPMAWTSVSAPRRASPARKTSGRPGRGRAASGPTARDAGAGAPRGAPAVIGEVPPGGPSAAAPGTPGWAGPAVARRVPPGGPSGTRSPAAIWPTAVITASQTRVSVRSPSGSGRGRPDASGAPSRMTWQRTARRPAAAWSSGSARPISTGARSSWIATPSSPMACSSSRAAGIWATVRR